MSKVKCKPFSFIKKLNLTLLLFISFVLCSSLVYARASELPSNLGEPSQFLIYNDFSNDTADTCTNTYYDNNSRAWTGSCTGTYDADVIDGYYTAHTGQAAGDKAELTTDMEGVPTYQFSCMWSIPDYDHSASGTTFQENYMDIKMENPDSTANAVFLRAGLHYNNYNYRYQISGESWTDTGITCGENQGYMKGNATCMTNGVANSCVIWGECGGGSFIARDYSPLYLGSTATTLIEYKRADYTNVSYLLCWNGTMKDLPLSDEPVDLEGNCLYSDKPSDTFLCDDFGGAVLNTGLWKGDIDASTVGEFWASPSGVQTFIDEATRDQRSISISQSGGSSDYLSGDELQNVTWECYMRSDVYPTGGGNYDMIGMQSQCAIGDCPSYLTYGTNVQLGVHSASSLTNFSYGSDFSSSYRYVTDKPFYLNTWYRLSMFYNAGDVDIYVDDEFLGRYDTPDTIKPSGYVGIVRDGTSGDFRFDKCWAYRGNITDRPQYTGNASVEPTDYLWFDNMSRSESGDWGDSTQPKQDYQIISSGTFGCDGEWCWADYDGTDAIIDLKNNASAVPDDGVVTCMNTIMQDSTSSGGRWTVGDDDYSNAPFYWAFDHSGNFKYDNAGSYVDTGLAIEANRDYIFVHQFNDNSDTLNVTIYDADDKSPLWWDEDLAFRAGTDYGGGWDFRSTGAGGKVYHKDNYCWNGTYGDRPLEAEAPPPPDTPPTVTLYSPDDASTVSSPANITCGAVDEEDELVNITLIIDSVWNESWSVSGNSSVQSSIQTLGDGTYTWNCNSCNNASLCANGTERTFTIDTTAPGIVEVNASGSINFTSDGLQVCGYHNASGENEWTLCGPTTDTTPTIAFTTDEDADCRFSSLQLNYTDMNTSMDCSTTGGEEQICTLWADISRTAVPTPLYLACCDSLNNCQDYVTSSPYYTFNITTNQVPVASSVNVAPDPAYMNDTLSCNYTYYDPDGDSNQSTFLWYNDSGIIDGQVDVTLTNTYFSRYDNLSCQVTPSDGYDNGTAVNSSILMISNIPPSVSDVNITPQPAYPSSTLNCSGIYSDYEGDPESGSTWNWTNQSGLIDIHTQTLDSDYFEAGDNISCIYTPSDGVDYGTPVASPNITITEFPSLPIINQINDDGCLNLTDTGQICGFYNNSVSGVQTVFNNSLGTENVTFTGDENFTRYIEVNSNWNVTVFNIRIMGYDSG